MSTVAVPTVIAGPLTREFEDIFREHYDLVHGTAFGVTGRREDAEDVVQTVFLRLLRREMPGEIQKNPKAYLYRAAVNRSEERRVGKEWRSRTTLKQESRTKQTYK